MPINSIKVIEGRHPLVGAKIVRILRDMDGIYIDLNNGMVLFLPDTSLYMLDRFRPHTDDDKKVL